MRIDHSIFCIMIKSDNLYLVGYSDVVEARLGQIHLGTFFSTQSQARRIQALLSKFLSDFGPYMTFKHYRLFWKLANPLQTFPFSRSSGTLYSGAYRTCKCGISIIASSKEKSGHFLIYHYITGWLDWDKNRQLLSGQVLLQRK